MLLSLTLITSASALITSTSVMLWSLAFITSLRLVPLHLRHGVVSIGWTECSLNDKHITRANASMSCASCARAFSGCKRKAVLTNAFHSLAAFRSNAWIHDSQPEQAFEYIYSGRLNWFLFVLMPLYIWSFSVCKRASISVPALISRFILPTYAASVRCFAERIFFEHIVTRISVPEAKCSAARFFNFSFWRARLRSTVSG